MYYMTNFTSRTIGNGKEAHPSSRDKMEYLVAVVHP